MFTPTKELKAPLNYHSLDRLPKEVTISTDKKRLLLSSTVDTSSAQSVFKHLSDAEVDSVCSSLDDDKLRYLSLGFKKVYLSIIPNAASNYDESRAAYNHLLQRIETSSKVPVISVYSSFKQDKRNVYSLSDAHWNNIGYGIWVTKVNELN